MNHGFGHTLKLFENIYDALFGRQRDRCWMKERVCKVKDAILDRAQTSGWVRRSKRRCCCSIVVYRSSELMLLSTFVRIAQWSCTVVCCSREISSRCALRSSKPCASCRRLMLEATSPAHGKQAVMTYGHSYACDVHGWRQCIDEDLGTRGQDAARESWTR